MVSMMTWVFIHEMGLSINYRCFSKVPYRLVFIVIEANKDFFYHMLKISTIDYSVEFVNDHLVQFSSIFHVVECFVGHVT